MAKLADIKTKQTSESVAEFIGGIADEQKRSDSRVILEMMEKATNQEPRMWGKDMIGFGKLVYKSPASGREVEWFKIGFSPRKTNLSLHLLDLSRHAAALERLGKHKTGKGCLYINRLKDIDIETLREIINGAAS